MEDTFCFISGPDIQNLISMCNILQNNWRMGWNLWRNWQFPLSVAVWAITDTIFLPLLGGGMSWDQLFNLCSKATYFKGPKERELQPRLPHTKEYIYIFPPKTKSLDHFILILKKIYSWWPNCSEANDHFMSNASIYCGTFSSTRKPVSFHFQKLYLWAFIYSFIPHLLNFFLSARNRVIKIKNRILLL